VERQQLNEKNAEIGIIGGTGVYDSDIIEDAKEIKIYTPFGRTSSLITIGHYKGKKIAFISRHGHKHQIPPHKIPFRANIWAFKELGVKRIISPSAVGSLKEQYKPSEFVIIDQFIDRTKSRNDTFYEGGEVCHISTADPFCPELRELLFETSKKIGVPAHKDGTYVCIQGPRFSTRAESKLFRSWGVEVIGMTLYPEVVLAREAEICFVNISMITDHDVWAERPVSTEEIMKTMSQNIVNLKKLIINAIPNIPKERHCVCKNALYDARI
jgi:5'-methylthioadenosine phosphorylase